MADKYEVLATLIETKEQYGQDAWAWTAIGVLRDLHDWSNGEITDEELPEAIYDRLLRAAEVKPFDEPLEPGEMDPETGRYNPNES